MPFFDGDDFHPSANKVKMASGTSLNDDDRAPWLAEIGATLAEPPGRTDTCIIACFALKRSYRDLLRNFAPNTVFYHLSGDVTTISEQVSNRKHEYMPGSLLASQMATLEPLGSDEAHVLVDIQQDPESMIRRIEKALKPSAEEDPPSGEPGPTKSIFQ